MIRPHSRSALLQGFPGCRRGALGYNRRSLSCSLTMGVPESPRAAEPGVAVYRFAGVVLDLRRGCLSVDGGEVPSTPQLLRLLQILCESGGRLLRRQEVFDALWPGGQSVSDAALSQLIWRLRALLGPYGGLVATVRRGGLRLDAAVSTETGARRSESGAANLAAPVPAEMPAPASADTQATAAAPAAVMPASVIPAAAPRRWTWAAAVLLLAAAAGAVLFWRGANPAVSEGYALYAADLQASHADTPRLAAAAFAADDAGDRERAIALMRSLHEADPATPVPAAMLTWWHANRSPAQSVEWAAAAQARLRADSPPYLRLFTNYFLARSGSGDFRGPLDALLDLRPSAWYLQNSRAHRQLAGREFAGALRSLQQVPLSGLDATLLADVLADRVALGDPAAEAIALRQPVIQADAVLQPFVRGRIAYSRGRLAEAIAALDASSRLAAELRQYDRQLLAEKLASLAAFELGSADLLPRLAAVRRLCQERGRLDCAADMLGFQAVLEARRGEAGRATALMTEAWQVNPHPVTRPALQLLALQNELAPPGDTEAVIAGLDAGLAFAGVAELLRGWQALARGDTAQARRQLALAREQGVAQTYNAEDASLLAARLGEPPQPCRVDPPYPNPLRLSACLRLRELGKNPKNQ
jgi:DNA-binding winged helix-turn-helix (wHTH) protein